jgi:hypothetical protein
MGLSDGVLSHWFLPMGKNSHTCAGRKTGQQREAGEGRGPAEHKYDLSHGKKNHTAT